MTKSEKIKYGIFTLDREYAEATIDRLKDMHGGKVDKYIKTKYELSCYMDDGTNFIWLKMNEDTKGFRCSKAIIDIATCSINFIKYIVLPMCIYANKKDIEIVTSIDIDTDLDTFIETLRKIKIIKGNIPVYYNNFDNCPNYCLGFKVDEDGVNLYG